MACFFFLVHAILTPIVSFMEGALVEVLAAGDRSVVYQIGAVARTCKAL